MEINWDLEIHDFLPFSYGIEFIIVTDSYHGYVFNCYVSLVYLLHLKSKINFVMICAVLQKL